MDAMQTAQTFGSTKNTPLLAAPPHAMQTVQTSLLEMPTPAPNTRRPYRSPRLQCLGRLTVCTSGSFDFS
ncbi:hypothetical protein RHBI111906_06415 [Rhodothermus bifroesti]